MTAPSPSETVFRSILIPISSEFYPPAVFQISARLAKLFGSSLTAVYISEKKTLDEVERLSDTHLSMVEEQETARSIRKDHLRQAEVIVFEDAQAFLRKRGLSLQTMCVEGEFGDVITSELRDHRYDLVVMGYGKRTFIDYHLLDELDVPVWVESGIERDSILAICSNLAPNQRVPTLARQLSTLLDKTLHLVYIADLTDPVIVDEQGRRSPKQSTEHLLDTGRSFVQEARGRGLPADLATGPLDREILRAAKRIHPQLVILGREQKVGSPLGFSTRNFKRKLAEHSEYSFLFVN